MVEYAAPMCIWHNCRLPKIKGGDYCKDHTKLAAIEKMEIEEEMARIAAKKKEAAK